MDAVITGAALVASGAWFADKLLGPSAEAIGAQLRVFASDRMTKIMNRAHASSKGEILRPLPVGFVYQAFQNASFSEDCEDLTDMWSNIFIDASVNFSSRHVLFSNILSQMGQREAYILKLMMDRGEFNEMMVSAEKSEFFRPRSIGAYSEGSYFPVREVITDQIEERISKIKKTLIDFENQFEDGDFSVTDLSHTMRNFVTDPGGAQLSDDEFYEYPFCTTENVYYKSSKKYVSGRGVSQNILSPLFIKQSSSFDVLISLGLVAKRTERAKTEFGEFEANFVHPTYLGLLMVATCERWPIEKDESEC